jgi:DNA-binding PadR family transcriptional regulator
MKKKVLNRTSHRDIDTPHVREVLEALTTWGRDYVSDMDLWTWDNLSCKPGTINRALQALHERKLADRIWHKADNGSRYYVYKLNKAGRNAARAVLNG